MVEAYYSSRKDTAYKGKSDLDAVYVATPDHWHAPISIAAMRKHKHVLCQKPMSHSIPDARRMAATAREMKVAAGLPVNNPSSESTRLIAHWIADGAIGAVREVHNWSSRPFWPQGLERPKEVQPVPDGLDWDMWLGPAPERPFNKAYLPFVWRGWFDFGCGSFGDMGCYSFAGVFKILDLTPPTSVEACESYDETYPKASIVHLNYPGHNSRSPVHMVWYDGGLRPPRPAGLDASGDHFFQKGESNEGILYVGDKGFILASFNGDRPRVYPENPKYQTPPARQRNAGGGPPRDAAIDQWIGACKGGAPSLTNFELQTPVTEAFLLGCLVQRFPGERFDWDTAAQRVTNSEKARYLGQEPRSPYKI
jgi:predicted dehydrogenase